MADANLYEGMFLVNLQVIGGDINAATAAVQEVLDRAEASAITLARWDERKLAYPIDNQKRGLYVHTLFNAAPDKIDHIERDVNLSETLLRVLITKGDHLGEVEIEQIKQGFIAAPTEEAGEAKEPASAQAAAE